MIIEHLPWESAEGPKYYAKELRPRKRWVTVGSWIMVGVLIFGGITTPYRVAAVFGLLYFLALLMVKTVAVTSRGLEIYYQMRITTHYDFWSWSQIQAVTREDRGHPELMAVYFTNDIRTKRLFFTKKDSEKVLELARACNPNIPVGDARTGEKPGDPPPKKKKK